VIGPHEGQELDLMLKGEKPFAMFHDITKSGYTSPEEIIPEQAFAPFIASGQIIRDERTFKSNKHQGEYIKYVCFALPDQSWRINTFFWLKEALFLGKKLPNNADEIIFGRLLGYDDLDINDYIAKIQK
jgi:hypothetical protein